MRFTHAVALASTAALLTLAAPTLARNSEAQKASEAQTASTCHAYQQAADGSWTQLPCQEMGSSDRKPAPKSADEEAH